MIHSDFEKNFVRAEVFSVQDLVECGSEKELRAQVCSPGPSKAMHMHRKPNAGILFDGARLRGGWLSMGKVTALCCLPLRFF